MKSINTTSNKNNNKAVENNKNNGGKNMKNPNPIIKTDKGNIVWVMPSEIEALKAGKASLEMFFRISPDRNKRILKRVGQKDLKLMNKILKIYEENDALVPEELLLEHKETFEKFGKLLKCKI